MSFITQSLSDEFKDHLMERGGWDTNCPVHISRLNLVEVSYLTFEKTIKTGKILALDVAAKSLIEIFKLLLISEFPLQSVNLLDQYGYDDYKSMSDNNSSCFNNRLILPRGEKYSIHAYGLAIDINPQQNPMISYKSSNGHYANLEIYPEEGKNYINRMMIKPGMVEHVVEIFLKNGFDSWGGLWNEPVDYHHFEVNRSLAEQLSKASKEEATNLWNKHLQECFRT